MRSKRFIVALLFMLRFRFKCIKHTKASRSRTPKEGNSFLFGEQPTKRADGRSTERTKPNKNQWLENHGSYVLEFEAQKKFRRRRRKNEDLRIIHGGRSMMRQRRGQDENRPVEIKKRKNTRRRRTSVSLVRRRKRTLIILENKNSRFPLRMTGKCLHVLSVFYASSLSVAYAYAHSGGFDKVSE